MQRFYLILVLILTFSCAQNNTRIVEFEKILGARQTKALNLLVSDFEKNLDKIYPDLPTEKGYHQYLIDIISDETTNWEKFQFQSDKTNAEFHKSGLWDEIYDYSYSPDLHAKDSTKILDVNFIGKYMLALYQIKDSDSLIKKYWEYRNAGGLMQKEIVVNGIQNLKPNFSDYFHKRIVVVEFSY